MNIEVRHVSETRKSLLVSLTADEVGEDYREVLREFSGQASLPGFRPGKVPLAVIEKRFGDAIAGELRNRVFNRALREATEKEKLDVLRLVETRDARAARGEGASAEFVVDVQLPFELGNYKGLATMVGPEGVTDAEVEQAIEQVRRERARFSPAEREARTGDYVRIKYAGTIDGQPALQLVKDRAIFAQMEQTWEEAGAAESMIPGMGLALLGLSKGDRKDVTVTFAADFSVEALRGKTATYAVEVLELRERQLPELDAAFFTSLETDSAEALRAKVRNELGQRKRNENRSAQRRQISEHLAAMVPVPVAESLLEGETQAVLRNFMEASIRRGANPDDFEARKQELYDDARRTAEVRVRVRMALVQVAKKEGLRLEDQDLNRAILAEAHRAEMAPEKYARQLGRDRAAVERLRRDVLLDKALEFLVDQATVTTQSAGAALA